MGRNAGAGNSTGCCHVMIGNNAGCASGLTGCANVFIGYDAGANTSGVPSHNVFMVRVQVVPPTPLVGLRDGPIPSSAERQE